MAANSSRNPTHHPPAPRRDSLKEEVWDGQQWTTASRFQPPPAPKKGFVQMKIKNQWTMVPSRDRLEAAETALADILGDRVDELKIEMDKQRMIGIAAGVRVQADLSRDFTIISSDVFPPFRLTEFSYERVAAAKDAVFEMTSARD